MTAGAGCVSATAQNGGSAHLLDLTTSAAASSRVHRLKQHVFIGRSVHSNICLQDPAVSNHHALIQPHLGGSWTIQLSSPEAKVLVSGRPLRPGRPISLQHNDRVLIPRLVQPDGGKPFHAFVFQTPSTSADAQLSIVDPAPELGMEPVLLCLTGPAQYVLQGTPVNIAGVPQSSGDLGNNDEHLRVRQADGKVIAHQVAPEGTYVNGTLLKQGEEQVLEDGDFLCPCKYAHKWRGSPAYIFLAGRRPRPPATPMKGLHAAAAPEVSRVGTAKPEHITLAVPEAFEVPGAPTTCDESSEAKMGYAGIAKEEDVQATPADCDQRGLEKRRRVAV